MNNPSIKIICCCFLGIFLGFSRQSQAQTISLTLDWRDTASGTELAGALYPTIIPYQDTTAVVSIQRGFYPPPGDLHCTGTPNINDFFRCRRTQTALFALLPKEFPAVFVTEGDNLWKCSHGDKRLLWVYKLCASIPVFERGQRPAGDRFRLNYEIDKESSDEHIDKKTVTADVILSRWTCSVKIVYAARSSPSRPDQMIPFTQAKTELCQKL
jgi:hypothetical protein